MTRSHVRPRDLRAVQRDEQVMKLRRMGLTNKAIGAEVGYSESWVSKKLVQLYTDALQDRLDEVRATLGEELDRIDGVIRACSAVLVSSRAAPGEKMRAASEIRRCSEAKVRWLGLAAPERLLVGTMDRAQMAEAEVAGLDDDAIERELEALGWKKGDVPPEDRQLEATVAREAG